MPALFVEHHDGKFLAGSRLRAPWQATVLLVTAALTQPGCGMGGKLGGEAAAQGSAQPGAAGTSQGGGTSRATVRPSLQRVATGPSTRATQQSHLAAGFGEQLLAQVSEAVTNEVNIISLKIPITRISVTDGDATSTAGGSTSFDVYTCPGATPDDCLVEMAGNALTNLLANAQPKAARPGKFTKIMISSCINNDASNIAYRLTASVNAMRNGPNANELIPMYTDPSLGLSATGPAQEVRVPAGIGCSAVTYLQTPLVISDPSAQATSSPSTTSTSATNTTTTASTGASTTTLTTSAPGTAPATADASTTASNQTSASPASGDVTSSSPNVGAATPVASPTADAAIALQLYFDLANVATASSGTVNAMAGKPSQNCVAQDAQHPYICLNFPDVVATLGTSSPSVKRFVVNDTSVPGVFAPTVLGLYFGDAPTPFGAYLRPFYDGGDRPMRETLQGSTFNRFMAESDGSVTIGTYYDWLVLPSFQLMSHAGTMVLNKAHDPSANPSSQLNGSVAYQATLLP